MADTAASLKMVAIDRTKIVKNTKTGFPVYRIHPKYPLVPPEQTYVSYVNGPHIWTEAERLKLESEGVTQLFLKESDLPAWEQYLKETEELQRELSPRVRIKQMEDVAVHLLRACKASKLDNALMTEMNSLATGVVDTLKDSLTAVRFIRGLIDHSAYTYHHSAGVSMLAPAIALQLGETDEAVLREYSLGGLMHDIGKLDIGEDVLNKPDALDEAEWELMRQHTVNGVNRIQGVAGVTQRVMNMVHYHHEKLDGSGYPKGLRGDDVPKEARICAVADIFNALTTTRSYHKKRTHFESLMLMKHNMSGQLWAPAMDALVMVLVAEEQK